ncbi:MAG TPA: hypothetical protein VLF90_03745 [Patescibacteria group bacterium]|nr:hypothetical protein [Patescibacteria group bacterium]
MTSTTMTKLLFKFATPKKRLSLSRYFPAGTSYFYAYPAGEDSGFLNKVSPKVEELVAARTLSCAGEDVSVVKFAATHSSVVGKDLIKTLGIPQLPAKQVIVLPEKIDANLAGTSRNKAIKEALLKRVRPGSLVMAQPYTDNSIAHMYQIPAQLSTWINDKNNMDQYIDPKNLPKRQAVYIDGEQFGAYHNEIKLPCVVKVTSSSSGDGVYICRTEQDMEHAMDELRDIKSTIFVEQYIEAKKNYGIHFGIPYDHTKPIDLIGVNEQLTTKDGEFMGGIIETVALPTELLPLEGYLLDEVLPKIRDMGWYGVGCFDVLCDDQDRLYLIDANFRVTGMSAYHFLISNGVIKKPLLSFGGEFVGNREQFEEALFPYASKNSRTRMVQMIALTRYGDTWSFNAALSFENHLQLKSRAWALLRQGIKSPALEHLIK